MKQVFPFFTLLMLSCILSLTSCSKDESINRDTLNELFKIYENGEIIECMQDGNIVYHAGKNAADAGSTIYDYDGNVLGLCNYAWGPVDSMCEVVENCKVIYRVKDNIWGLPAANEYYLGLR